MRLSSESSPPLHPSELAEAPVEEKSSDSESESSEPRPLSLKKRRAIVAPACTPYGTLAEIYEVSKLLSVRAGKRAREFSCAGLETRCRPPKSTITAACGRPLKGG